MKRAAWLILTVVLAGCGSDKQARRGDDEGGPEFAMRQQRAKKLVRPGDGPAEMKVDNELGVLESRDVEATLEGHFEEVRSCYARAGKAQRYAEGKVLLRFLIEGDGRARDVWVVESTLGNYEVERCLVEVGRRLIFDAPNGRKATTFDYPVEFRSSNQVAVINIDGLKIERDVAAFLPQLAPCGPLAQGDAVAIMYIESNGLPGSVGLAAGSALDEDAGDCVVQTMRRWRMSASLPNRVLRATFGIPPVIASASATASQTAAAEIPRRAASSVSGRRRHR